MITAIAGIISIIGLIAVITVTASLIIDVCVERATRKRADLRREYGIPLWDEKNRR